MSILEVATQLSIWGPIVLFSIGVLSALLNMIIFSGIKSYRQSPSSSYIVGQSISNIGTLLIFLLQNIPSTSGFASSISCKLLIYFSQIAAPSAMSFLCLSAFDRWACTSRSARIRKLSSIRISHNLFLFTFIFWSVIGIPYLIFTDLLPPTLVCLFTNEIFAKISLYFLSPIFSCIFPLIILLIFGILTYRNIFVNHIRQELNRNRLSMWEQQMTRMMISQIILSILCTLPRTTYTLYLMAIISELATKRFEQIAIEYFINQLTSVIFGINFASSFYIFLLFSPRFRQTIKMYLTCQFHLRNNQVGPMRMSLKPTHHTTMHNHEREN